MERMLFAGALQPSNSSLTTCAPNAPPSPDLCASFHEVHGGATGKEGGVHWRTQGAAHRGVCCTQGVQGGRCAQNALGVGNWKYGTISMH